MLPSVSTIRADCISGKIGAVAAYLLTKICMAKNEKTGKAAGSSASKVMKGKGTVKDAKKAAASALTQRPDKKKAKK